MGSQGKKKGRRTRSDTGGGHVRPAGDGPIEWPGLSGQSVLTPEGRIEQLGHVASNLSRANGRRARIVRAAFLIPAIAIIGGAIISVIDLIRSR